MRRMAYKIQFARGKRYITWYELRRETGITLIEMLVVISVIAILTTAIIGIAGYIDNQGKERLTKNAFALLDAAIGQFRDYGYQYRNNPPDPDERKFYKGLVFPLDYNDFTNNELENKLEEALRLPGILISGGTHKDEYSGSEALYLFLSRVPESRKTLGDIDGALIKNAGSDKQPMVITIDNKEYPLLRIVDPWGKTLHYDYYDEALSDFVDMEKSKRSFPVITSAGPDGLFGTADDMSSR